VAAPHWWEHVDSGRWRARLPDPSPQACPRDHFKIVEGSAWVRAFRTKGARIHQRTGHWRERPSPTNKSPSPPDDQPNARARARAAGLDADRYCKSAKTEPPPPGDANPLTSASDTKQRPKARPSTRRQQNGLAQPINQPCPRYDCSRYEHNTKLYTSLRPRTRNERKPPCPRLPPLSHASLHNLRPQQTMSVQCQPKLAYLAHPPEAENIQHNPNSVSMVGSALGQCQSLSQGTRSNHTTHRQIGSARQ
jgi:hypothetical protein